MIYQYPLFPLLLHDSEEFTSLILQAQQDNKIQHYVCCDELPFSHKVPGNYVRLSVRKKKNNTDR